MALHMRSDRMARWAVLALGLVLACGTASADSWVRPEVRAVVSDGASYVARVVPAGRGSPARASVYRHDSDTDSYRKLIDYPLQDRVAPVDALLGPDGALVTLDGWAAMGQGMVLRVYDLQGKVRIERSLKALLGERAAKVPESVSSRWWRCGQPRLIEGGASLSITTWDEGTLRVDLHSGEAHYAPGKGNCL